MEGQKIKGKKTKNEIEVKLQVYCIGPIGNKQKLEERQPIKTVNTCMHVYMEEQGSMPLQIMQLQ